ncbi:cuticle protein AM1199-like [Macrobrachium rosenbergii]|uniref:cuticle protein AM1199-like n=1 Tax=Macrobrachium rosenbergii TaxID=79674 RepID=UPI0034D7719D
MKLTLLFACCVGCVLARPEKPAAFGNAVVAPTPVPILVDEREPIDSFGGYGFKIVTGDGQSKSESSSRAGLGKMVTKGQYSFTHPDGQVHVLSYTAGVNGFEPISDMLPTPHPLEPWHLEQIRFAERQRRLQELAEARAALEAKHKQQ